ncbi:hypothetical protein [Candidatus Magnetominusculus dajiuhuensis]|uniref:hypothetical protein n=1 Tax=Candidatus Magnetominusculus dajiuhuensis TaxID=3137712 RepID=UPI003B42A4B2
MKKIIIIAIAALLSFVLISCGHKGPPTLKETSGAEKKEAPPQKPQGELSPYEEDTSRLRPQ